MSGKIFVQTLIAILTSSTWFIDKLGLIPTNTHDTPLNFKSYVPPLVSSLFIALHGYLYGDNYKVVKYTFGITRLRR